jgi:hypothetical protein
MKETCPYRRTKNREKINTKVKKIDQVRTGTLNGFGPLRKICVRDALTRANARQIEIADIILLWPRLLHRYTCYSPNFPASPFTSLVFSGVFPTHPEKSPHKCNLAGYSHTQPRPHVFFGEERESQRRKRRREHRPRNIVNGHHLPRPKLFLSGEFECLVPYPPIVASC